MLGAPNGRRRAQKYFLIVSALLALGFTAALANAVPAFPGAVGFGTDTTHGRGGRVMKVTSLANDGPSSLRAALMATGKRVIVFDVSGIVRLRGPIKIGAAQSEFYLAGQSAPGAGVVVVGATVEIDGTRDFVIRHVRFRRGDYNYGPGPGEGDSMTIVSATNAVVDHCTFSWSWDSALDLKGFHNFTLSHTLIGNGCNEAIHDQSSDWWHNKLMLLGGFQHNRLENSRLSFYRNLFCYGDDRPPQICDAGSADVVNNVFFGNNTPTYFVGRPAQKQTKADLFGNPDFGWHINFIGNYWFNPGAPLKSIELGVRGNGKVHPQTRLFLADNFNNHFAKNAAPAEQPQIISGAAGTPHLAAQRLDTGTPPHAYAPLRSAEVWPAVLGDVGATIPRRDFVDAELLRRVREQKPAVDLDERGPFPTVLYPKVGMDSQLQVTGLDYFQHDFGGKAPADADADGLPDAWETAHGLNPNDAADAAKLLASGYSAIVEYVNGLVAAPDEPTPPRRLPSAQDALFDGGFEGGVCGWKARACRIQEFTGDAHTGRACVEVYERVKRTRGTYIEQRIINDLTRLGKGRYTGEAWVKLKPGAKPTTASIKILLLDTLKRGKGGSEARVITLGTAPVNSDGWTKISGTAAVDWTALGKSDDTWPGGAFFTVDVENPSASFLLDDCVLRRASP